jgi:UDP-glucose 4-epimerase
MDQSRVPDFVVSRFIDAALKHKPITIYGDGGQTRTFCYIDDHLEATVNCLLHNKYTDDVVNIGNDQEIFCFGISKNNQKDHTIKI